MIEEFERKHEILKAAFKQVSQQQFYTMIFEEVDQPFVYLLVDEPHGKIRRAMNFEDVSEVGVTRNDLYLPMAKFFNDYYCSATLEKLYALVVDLDKISSESLEKMLIPKVLGLSLKPTLIHNSGGGVHLIWVLSEPFECYRRYLPDLKTINERLRSQFKALADSSDFKVDTNVGIIQGYRLMGSLSKLGQRTAGYQCGQKHSIQDVAVWLGVDVKPWFGKTPSDRARQMEKKARTVKKRVYTPNAQAPFYIHCLERIYNEVSEGHRFTSLRALSIVEWKCKIPREVVEQDAWSIYYHFQNLYWEKPFREREVSAALISYCEKATRVRSTTLENLFGFQFERKIKRNGRKRHEHLKIMNGGRAEKQIERIEMVRDIISSNPRISESELARMTSMSRTTIRKYKKKISNAA